MTASGNSMAASGTGMTASGNSMAASGTGMAASGSGMTLPQIIDIYGRRILQLEKTVGEGPVSNSRNSSKSSNSSNSSNSIANPAQVKEIVQECMANPMDELHARYELLAQEIHSLKDVVLHLQDYTMSVNQRLLEGAFAPPPPVAETATLDDDIRTLQEDIQFLQAHLEKTPEEYELNEGI